MCGGAARRLGIYGRRLDPGPLLRGGSKNRRAGDRGVCAVGQVSWILSGGAGSARHEGLSALAHAGGSAGVPRPRAWPPTEARTATQGARPGDSLDRMDVRPARREERAFQSGAAGGGGAAVRSQSVRHHGEPVAPGSADRPVGGGVVGRVAARGRVRRRPAEATGRNLPLHCNSA